MAERSARCAAAGGARAAEMSDGFVIAPRSIAAAAAAAGGACAAVSLTSSVCSARMRRSAGAGRYSFVCGCVIDGCEQTQSGRQSVLNVL